MSLIFYFCSILVANWLVLQFGIITIGPLVFPAGAVAVGITFSARDYVQKQYGKWGCWLWMLLACVVTYFLNPTLALASVTAFAVAEIVDWIVYSFSKLPFKKRIMLSNVFSTPIDSIVFVVLAFGWTWPVIIGQTIVKFISSGVVLLSRDTA